MSGAFPVVHLERIDSTNEELKRRARAGEDGPLAVVAREQTGGKGRRGRSFLSLPDKGLYLSVLFRPDAPAETLSQLTAWTAVAVCRAVEGVCGAKVGVKWPNDVLAGGKKLCGILTELVEGRVIVGMGVNLTQTGADFGPELADKAVSLAQLGCPADAAELEAALLRELDALRAAFPREGAVWLEEYRRRCLTLGRAVVLSTPAGETPAQALDVDGDFALRVRLADGREERVSSGEVSVRGVLGYH